MQVFTRAFFEVRGHVHATLGDKFRAVNEAHEILSDPKKKQIYDKYVSGM
jgi:curved DNA-binding protein CbpA